MVTAAVALEYCAGGIGVVGTRDFEVVAGSR